MICCHLLLLTIIICVSCAPHTKSISSSAHSKPLRTEFKFRYNALFNTDQELDKIYQDLVKRRIQEGDCSIVIKPESGDSSKTREVIKHLQELLIFQPLDDIRNEIYYRIALSYFLEENYHTALAYLELLDDGFNSDDAQILKAQCYLFMDQQIEACNIINQLTNLKRTKKNKAHIAAIKAEIFSRQNIQDSAIYYLEEAISYKTSGDYQPIWKLRLGKWYAHNKAERADYLFKQVARSYSAESRLKLEAHLQRILLQQNTSKDRIAAATALLKKGFTINNEWQNYAFIAREYSQMEQVDSAISNYEKVLNHPFSPTSVKDVTRGQLDNFYRSIVVEDTTLNDISDTSDEETNKLSTWYEKMYALYDESKHSELIAESDIFLQRVSCPIWLSKVAYLRALAIGYSQPMDSLIQAFERVTEVYNGNTTVVKRVKAHLNFIQENESYYQSKNPVLEKPKEGWNFTLPLAEQEDTVIALATLNNGTLIDDLHIKYEPYYYVILIANPRENLTPTRYRIGQFIRTKFPNKKYRHALKHVDDEYQFIYVGDFSSFEDCEAFQISIEKLLPEIIKVREKKYSTFVIPKRELDTMEDISSINKYLKK